MTIEYPMPPEFIGNVEEIASALRTIRKLADSTNNNLSSDKDLQTQIENTFQLINKTLTAGGL